MASRKIPTPEKRSFAFPASPREESPERKRKMEYWERKTCLITGSNSFRKSAALYAEKACRKPLSDIRNGDKGGVSINRCLSFVSNSSKKCFENPTSLSREGRIPSIYEGFKQPNFDALPKNGLRSLSFLKSANNVSNLKVNDCDGASNCSFPKDGAASRESGTEINNTWIDPLIGNNALSNWINSAISQRKVTDDFISHCNLQTTNDSAQNCNSSNNKFTSVASVKSEWNPLTNLSFSSASSVSDSQRNAEVEINISQTKINNSGHQKKETFGSNISSFQFSGGSNSQEDRENCKGKTSRSSSQSSDQVAKLLLFPQQDMFSGSSQTEVAWAKRKKDLPGALTSLSFSSASSISDSQKNAVQSKVEINISQTKINNSGHQKKETFGSSISSFQFSGGSNSHEDRENGRGETSRSSSQSSDQVAKLLLFSQQDMFSGSSQTEVAWSKRKKDLPGALTSLSFSSASSISDSQKNAVKSKVEMNISQTKINNDGLQKKETFGSSIPDFQFSGGSNSQKDLENGRGETSRNSSQSNANVSDLGPKFPSSQQWDCSQETSSDSSQTEGANSQKVRWSKREKVRFDYSDYPEVVNFETDITVDEEWKDKLLEGMRKIKEREAVSYEQLFARKPQRAKQTKDAIISKITSVLAESQDLGAIEYRSKSYANCVFSEGCLVMKPFEATYKSFTMRNSKLSQAKYHLIRALLANVKSLLESGATVTKRELYYQNLHIANKSEKVMAAIDCMSIILDAGPWEFGVFGTGKGLVYGNLSLLDENYETIHCNGPGGVLIPQNIESIVQMETDAEFIVVVEKDTIFQKLLDENFRQHLPISFILITGKGYPDSNARLFLNKLYEVLKIPVFILVDANPFGIDIMLTYRVGSLAMAHLSHDLTVPNLHWLGVFPSEITTLNLVKQTLTDVEMAMIKRILQRDYMHHFPKVREELEVLREKRVKSEIEGVMKTDEFLSRVYLPMKFYNRDYL